MYDPRTAQVDEVPPADPLRVHAFGPDLRSHVLADVIRRLTELRHRTVMVTATPVRDLTALNIPPADAGDPDGADLSVGHVGPVARDESPPAVAGTARLVPVGPSAGEQDLSWAAERGLDPLSIRLAALECPYRDLLSLDARTLEEADRELRRLRTRVAEWAESPSKPMRAGHTAEAFAALDADLDVPGALRVLRELDAADLPPGAKFETFAHFDMVLALDLVREVGRPRPAGA